MSLAQGNNTPTRPRIEPESLDPESDVPVMKITVFNTKPLYHMSRVMKTLQSEKQQRTAALLRRLVITLVIRCLYTVYALLFFLSFYLAKLCLKFLCLFIYSFFVVSISDYGIIFIDRLSKLDNIVAFSDRRT